MRPMGKIAFAHIDDGEGRIQLFFRVNDVGADNLKMLVNDLDLGDFIEAEGDMMRTKTVFQISDLGKHMPKPTSVKKLQAGEVGYIVANIRTLDEVHIGDVLFQVLLPDAPVVRRNGVDTDLSISDFVII